MSKIIWDQIGFNGKNFSFRGRLPKEGKGWL